MDVINYKEEIIINLKSGRWSLDLLAPVIFEKIIETQTSISGDTCPKNLKNYAIEYYCQTKSYLDTLFYANTVNNEFNNIILSKIAKPGVVTSFNDEEQFNIINCINFISNMGAGYSEFIKNLSFIKINSFDFRSASSPHLIGGIALTNQINFNNKYDLQHSIIHELAHQELFLINFFDRLIQARADGVTVLSPYQQVERPPIGRLHSLWALFRMIQHGQRSNMNSRDELILFTQTRDTLIDDVLTNFGKKLVETAREYIEKNN